MNLIEHNEIIIIEEYQVRARIVNFLSLFEKVRIRPLQLFECFPFTFLRVKGYMVNLLNTLSRFQGNMGYQVRAWSYRIEQAYSSVDRNCGHFIHMDLARKKIMIMVISQSLCESFLVLLKREWEGGGAW